MNNQKLELTCIIPMAQARAPDQGEQAIIFYTHRQVKQLSLGKN